VSDKKPYRPPEEFIKHWPEVFEHIYMKSMPIRYIHGVEIKFGDGRIWEVDITEQLPFSSENEIVAKLTSALKEIASEVKSINFNININKLKADIEDQTKNILRDE
jgi:hypothetical protein